MNNIIVTPEKRIGYSRLVGCIYIFNLIVGTGALTLPKAFQAAGWLLGSIVLTILCFLSYITSTYVIEAMSISNGLQKLSKIKYALTNNQPYTTDDINDEYSKTLLTYKINYGSRDAYTSNDITHSTDITRSTDEIIPSSDDLSDYDSYFEICDTFEMGQMAILYFNRIGLVFFYLAMCIYLYGDLAVYAAAVPTTLRDVVCTYQLNHSILNNSSLTPILNKLTEDDLCWTSSDISRINAYRIFLTGFVVLLCPFVFFNVSKTKVIQFTTLSMRWFAFAVMFILMSIYLAGGNHYGVHKIADVSMTPNLLGVCIYSFMCHHSLPSLITPIKKKNNIYLLCLIIFIVILVFYLVLSFLATFTFASIQSLITLNFKSISEQPNVTDIAFFQYYLSLFPVFAISASFPIIGITLRNNLRNLITCGTGRKFNSWIMENMFYPLLAIIPPIALVYGTHDITLLVGFTGSYAGTFIQYVIPISLVYYSKRNLNVFLTKLKEHSLDNFGITEDHLYQPHQSPFSHIAWLLIILFWSVISIVFVTVNHFLSG